MEVLAKTKKKQKSFLAKNIISGRDKLGLNAMQFAERAKIPYPTLRDIEADISGGSKKTKQKIAEALGCQVWELDAPESLILTNKSYINHHGPDEQSAKEHANEGQRDHRENGDDYKSNPKGVNPTPEGEVDSSIGDNINANDKLSILHTLSSEASEKILNKLELMDSKLDKKDGPSMDAKKRELFDLISGLDADEADIFIGMIKRRLSRKPDDIREP